MLNERKLTEKELEKRAEAIQGLLSNKRTLVKKYGKDAEKVMYGIATKQSKKKVETMNLEKVKELIQNSLKEDNIDEKESNDVLSIDRNTSGGANYGEEDKALGQEDELEMKGLEEGHGLDQGDIDVLQNFVDRAEVKDRKIKKILKFIIKSNILQDKTKDLSIKEDKFSNAAMNDVMQSIRNLAHTTGMDELEAAEIAINEIKIEFGVDAFHESVNEAEGSTINLSQSDMDKLHSNGKLDLDGHKLVYKTNEVKEDLDIGHQDDEPGMLKAELTRS
jgi:hypothetical protein